MFVHARVHSDNKTQEIGFNHDYNMTLFINILYFKTNVVLEARAVCYATGCPLNEWNCHLTVPLPHAFDIGVFKCNKKQFYHNKIYYNESYLTVVALLLTPVIGGISH